MSKRKRAASEGCCPPSSRSFDSKPSSPPLTSENLERLQHSLGAPEHAPAMAGAASSRSASPNHNSTTHDAIHKLEEYNIRTDSSTVLPEQLQDFLDNVILRPRDLDTAPSPNAKKIVKRHRAAARTNEAAGREQLVPYLLFSGEFNDREGVEQVPYVTCLPEVQLNTLFSPPCPNTATKKTWGALSQPRPDSCLGYVLRGDARAAGCEAPFTPAEEGIMNDYVLTKAMYMPFITGQWKSPIGGENILIARCQAARDGATIVNYLHTLYRIAYDKEPSPVHVCHFSVIGDVITGQIWVHYQEGGIYHMHKLYSFEYDDQRSLERARGYLHNIKDHALGARLQSIKHVLPVFDMAKKPRNPFPAVPMSESAGPLPSLPETDASNFRAPLTPTSVVSGLTKKRRRVASSDVANSNAG